MKGFLKQATNALAEISGGNEGSTMISELENSANNFVIIKGDSKFNESNVSKAYANQLKTDPSKADALKALTAAGIDLEGGSGGVISWNPSDSVLPTTMGGQTNSVTDFST